MDPDENPDRLAVHGVTMDESHTETMNDGTVIVKTSYTKTTTDDKHAEVFGSQLSKSPSIKTRIPSLTSRGSVGESMETHVTTYEIKVNSPEPIHQEISSEFFLERKSIPDSPTIWKTEKYSSQTATSKSVETSISDTLVVDSPTLLQSKSSLDTGNSGLQPSVSKEFDISEYLIQGGPTLLASKPPVGTEKDGFEESKLEFSASKDFNVSEYIIEGGPTLLASEPPLKMDKTDPNYSMPDKGQNGSQASSDFVEQSSVLLAHHSPVKDIDMDLSLKSPEGEGLPDTDLIVDGQLPPALEKEFADVNVKQTVVTVDKQANMEQYAWHDDEIKVDTITSLKSKPKSLKKGKQIGEVDTFVKHAMQTYNVFVYTGSKWGAGTDANVYLILHGSQEHTEKIFLRQSRTNKNPFERNACDEFAIEALDIGELQKIR